MLLADFNDSLAKWARYLLPPSNAPQLLPQCVVNGVDEDCGDALLCVEYGEGREVFLLAKEMSEGMAQAIARAMVHNLLPPVGAAGTARAVITHTLKRVSAVTF